MPKLADQNHAIKTGKQDNQSVLVVTGGSANATLWAAYELGWRYGVRYFLFGDLYPAQASAFTVEGHDIVLRPSVARRTWYAFTNSQAGTVSWGFDEHKRTLVQLTKLKYTLVIARATDLNEYASANNAIVVSGDTQGRTVLGGARLFDNPELASAKEPSQWTAAH